MNRKIVLIFFSLLAGSVLYAQTDLHEVRRGNRRFAKGNWRESGIEYMKGLAKDSTSFVSSYNLSSALYREKKWDEASKTLQECAETADDSANAADYYFNYGDIALQKQDYKSAVDAFKKSLLLRPDDFEAKENYTYAKMKLEQQNQQDQNQDQQNQDQQDQNNDQDRNQDQNQQDRNQDQQDQNNDQDRNQQDRNREQQPPKISPQQAQQMLSAIQAKEKETQDKVNKEKAALLQSRQKEKNW